MSAAAGMCERWLIVTGACLVGKRWTKRGVAFIWCSTGQLKGFCAWAMLSLCRSHILPMTFGQMLWQCRRLNTRPFLYFFLWCIYTGSSLSLCELNAPDPIQYCHCPFPTFALRQRTQSLRHGRQHASPGSECWRPCQCVVQLGVR